MSCHRLSYLLAAAGSAVLTGGPVGWGDTRSQHREPAATTAERHRGTTARSGRSHGGHSSRFCYGIAPDQAPPGGRPS